MIVKDCFTSGDRERILKANEMMTNAQFGVDDFSTPEFLKSLSRSSRKRYYQAKEIIGRTRKTSS